VCCDTHLILSPLNSFEMASYYSTWEGHAYGNSQEANNLYKKHCPQCKIPSHKLFTKLHQRLTKSGSFAQHTLDCRRPPSVCIPDMEVHILRRMEEDPGTGARRTAAAEGISVPLT
jgi:hypothetical protein